MTRFALTRLVALTSTATFLSACVHTTPNPVPVAQAGDDTMSCMSIENEMADMQTEQASSDSKGAGQVAKNVGLGVAGAFLLVPWFFMDTSDAHSVEAKAAQARYKRLNALYMDKGCIPPGKNAAPTVAEGTVAPSDSATQHKVIKLDPAAAQ